MKILDRFLKYVSIDTTSDSKKEDTPSTNNQFKLAKLLVEELRLLNVDQIHFDQKNCYVYGMLMGDKELPKIGFVSHLDTSEAASGKNIKPNIIINYDGNDVKLNDNVVLSTEVYPDLKNHVGKTLITTDGTTLLGADDKAGIAEIMSMLEYYASSDEKHGDIYVCFTPDEEIGLGTLHLDKKYFSPDFAYAVDGISLGDFSYENFNAASASIEITGVPTHLGYAKDVLINAVHIATLINAMLPDEVPENTEGYEGYFCLEDIKGDISKTTMEYIIRDFDKENFENRKQLLTKIVEILNKKYNNSIKLNIKDTYYNMFDVINKDEDLIKSTLTAITNTGVTPNIEPVRGGSDGTRISYDGIPCPILGAGGHNFHSVYEYVCLEDMEKITEILISIVKQFSKNKQKKK